MIGAGGACDRKILHFKIFCINIYAIFFYKNIYNNESSLLSPEIPKIRFLTKVQDNVGTESRD